MEATMEHLKDQEHSQSQTVHWRIFIFSAILSLTGLFCAPQLDADIYHWIDENGVKHYGNKPPANAGNAKKVFDEYQHDETAHQKRLKTDQKTIDALTEEIKKEEQQASVEEQKKLEKAKQNQPRLFGSKCFSPSYSIQQGRGVRQNLVPRNLMPGEYEDLLKLFESLKGYWNGTAWKLNCKDNEGEVREEMDNYTIKSEGKMHSRGEFVLKSNLYSREKNSTRVVGLPLYLDPKKLTSDRDMSVSDIELISVSSDELVYVQKGLPRILENGARLPSHREFVTTIKKTGKDSFSFERNIYYRGKLITINSWNLENN